MKLIALKIIRAILHYPSKWAYRFDCFCAGRYDKLNKLRLIGKLRGKVDLMIYIITTEKPVPSSLLKNSFNILHYLKGTWMVHVYGIKKLFKLAQGRYYQRLFGFDERSKK